MSDAIVRSIPVQVTQWTPEQKDLIKRTVARDCTDDELAMFLHVAAKAGLDPLLKQIHCTKMGGRLAFIADINGLQARAAREADFEGIDHAVVYEKDEFLVDQTTGEVVVHKSNPFTNGRPVGAWAVVHRAGKKPFRSMVRFSEYENGNNPLWKSKPGVMIDKVAKSTALRLAYPEQLGSLYAPEEVGRTEQELNAAPAVAKPTAREAAKQKAAQLSAGAPPQTIEAPRKASTAIIDVQPGETEEQAEQRTHSEPPPHDAETGEVMEEVLVPFGRDKGKPLSEASDKSLSWLMDYAQQAIADPAKAKYVESNKRLAEAIEAELDKRR